MTVAPVRHPTQFRYYFDRTARGCASTELLLPLIKAPARNAELTRQLAHVGAPRHPLHRRQL
jgi:hypothetical protein